MSKKQPKLVSMKDLGIAVSLLAAGLFSLLVPTRYWKPASMRLAGLVAATPGLRLRSVERFVSLAKSLPALRNVKDIRITTTQTYIESRVQIVDQYLAKKWKPKIDCHGIARIRAGLDTGNGVILWVTPFAYSDLVAKMGISLAGIDVSHLSRPEHGFSKTRIGMATLNKLRVGIENHYIKDRVRIKDGEQQRAMLALRRVLKENGVVSITVGAQTKRPDSIALGNGRLKIATGAIRLSEMTGAPILPVFAINTSAQRYAVHIEESVSLPERDIPGVLTRYAVTLEKYLAQHPSQWRGIHDFVAN